jgi:MT0933-like antitoxin protein
MGIFDKAKDALSGKDHEIDGSIDKAGDMVDEKTDNKYVEQVDRGQEMAKDKVSDLLDDKPEAPA